MGNKRWLVATVIVIVLCMVVGMIYYNVITNQNTTRSPGDQPPPAATISPASPVTFNGVSDDVKNISLSPGAVRFDMNYAGTGYFSITIHDSNGNYVGLMGISIGNYSGSDLLTVALPGAYYLSITGIGLWSVTVSHM